MFIHDTHVIGVDLPLLVHHGIDKEEFKQACGQVPNLMQAADNLVTNATFGKSISPKKAYLAYSGGLGSCIARYIVDRALGKDRVVSIFDKVLAYPTTVDHVLAFVLAHGGPVIQYSGDPLDLGYLVRIDGSRVAQSTCACDGNCKNRAEGKCDCDGTCKNRSEGCGCDGTCAKACDPQDDTPSVRPLAGWTDAQVWAAFHVLKIPFSKDFLPPAP